MWIKEPTIDQALTKLNDAICTYERQTGREFTLLLIPFQKDEKIFASQSGKPIEPGILSTPEDVLKFAMIMREKSPI